MHDRLLDRFDVVRYVAVYRSGRLESKVRAHVTDPSSSDSDVYEELLVNPTILKLIGQRGDIDCGGLEYVVIRYGNFFQLVIPKNWGHVSVCLESSSDLTTVIPAILNTVSEE